MSQKINDLVTLSQKLLIACDQSYAGKQLVSRGKQSVSP